MGGAKSGEPGDHLGAERLLRLLQVAHPLAHDLRGARRDRPRRPAAGRASPRSGCRARRARPRCGSRPARARAARAPRCARRGPASQRPSAPATTVSTASFTVPPRAFLISLKSARRLCTQRMRRCGPIGTFSGTSGAGFMPAQTISPRPSAASRTLLERLARVLERRRARGPPARTACARGPSRPRRRGPRRMAPGAAASRRRLQLRRHGREVEQHGGDVHARHAVHEGVVGLRDQREAAVARAPGRSRPPRAASSGRGAGRRSGPTRWRSCSSLPGLGSAVWRTW